MRAPRAVGAGARACAGEGGPQWRGGCASTGVNAHRRAAAAARRRRPARRPRAPAIENRGRPCGPDRRALPQARASSAPSASRPLAARGNCTPPHSRRVHRGRHRPISRPPRTSARTPRRARRPHAGAVRAAHFQASGNGDCASSRAIGVLGAPSPGAMRRAVGSDAPAADAADAAGSVVAKGCRCRRSRCSRSSRRRSRQSRARAEACGVACFE